MRLQRRSFSIQGQRGGGRRVALRNRALLEEMEPRVLLSTIQVLGNGQVIAGGSTTLSTVNATEFGKTDVNDLTVSAIYTIRDPDPVTGLTLTGNPLVAVSGNNPSDFVVTAQPASASVAANNGVYQLAKRTSMPARMLNPLGQDKLVRATAAMNLASEGRIWLPPPGLRPGMPLEDLEAEWYRFTGTKDDANDDAVDMLSYGARVLTSGPTAVGRNAVPMILGGNM